MLQVKFLQLCPHPCRTFDKLNADARIAAANFFSVGFLVAYIDFFQLFNSGSFSVNV